MHPGDGGDKRQRPRPSPDHRFSLAWPPTKSRKSSSVHHWNDSLFSFTTTRDHGLRFENGHFVMIGSRSTAGRCCAPTRSPAPNYEEHLEFFSIKVPDGPLTSRLQHLKAGDDVLVGSKPTGTLVIDDLLPGKRLYCSPPAPGWRRS